MYKAILWDIDGTILDFLAAERAAIRKCFEIFGLGKCTDDMIEEYSRINVRYWEALERGEMSKPEILVGRFREFFNNHGLDTGICPDFNKEYQLRLGDTIVFFDGALDVLNSLRGKVRQVAVTNGTKAAQVRKLANSGLDGIFDVVFISEEVGYEKPDIRFFAKVFESIGVCPSGSNINKANLSPSAMPEGRQCHNAAFCKSDIIIVGDSLTSDILGGNIAGITTCLFNPYGKELPSPEELEARNQNPDIEIHNLREVLDIVQPGS